MGAFFLVLFAALDGEAAAEFVDFLAGLGFGGFGVDEVEEEGFVCGGEFGFGGDLGVEGRGAVAEGDDCGRWGDGGGGRLAGL